MNASDNLLCVAETAKPIRVKQQPGSLDFCSKFAALDPDCHRLRVLHLET